MEIPNYTGHGVYIIWNNDNNRYYIGSSKNCQSRIKDHIIRLNSKTHHSWKLQWDWSKFFNWDCFILKHSTPETLIDDEQWCFDIQKPFYNILLTAHSCLGVKRST